MTTFVFPGQGSQQRGMGAELFDMFSELTAKADEVLGYSIKSLCLHDEKQQLHQTQYTQPALYVVNALSYLERISKSGKRPDFVAGHSLGEYNALFAADVFDFETGLRIVMKRGELMGRANGGGMAAVIGMRDEHVAEMLEQNGLLNIDIANYNSPFQVVISGLKSDLDRARAVFEGRPEVRMVVPLKTSGAFHSRYMEPAQKKFEAFLDGFELHDPTIPVISNVSARPYSGSTIKANLVEQISCPVKWTESIRYLMGLGEMVFEEIGTGRVLTGLIERIKKEVEPLIIVVSEKESPSCKMQAVRVDSSAHDETAGPLPDKDNNQRGEKKGLASAESATVDVGTVLETGAGESGMRHTPEVLTKITPSSLGSPEFREEYKLKYAYLSGAMYRGIASSEMVIRMGKAGMMGFFGTGGLELSQIRKEIQRIQGELSDGQAYGMNFLHHPNRPEIEERTVDLFLGCGVNRIEAAAFLSITPALVRYRLKGLKRGQQDKIITLNKIIAKVSRPEVAEAFMSPAPEPLLTKLLSEKKITREEADLSQRVPMADDICAEADSGGHTDRGVLFALLPAVIALRNEMMQTHQYEKTVRVGAAGGIGTPEAAAAAFILGADFILTGSINQCTVEAATSDRVKELLQQMNVQDTDYAPAGDMFELGAKIQVLKKGLFFPARANKLYDLYRQHSSLDEIDEKTKKQIQEKYFKKSFEEVYEDIQSYYPAHVIEKAEQSPKYKMALIFKWYFRYSTRLALGGNEECRVDYQVLCGPALGAFNQWVKGTALEDWRNRHVDEIAVRLMTETAEILQQRFQRIITRSGERYESKSFYNWSCL